MKFSIALAAGLLALSPVAQAQTFKSSAGDLKIDWTDEVFAGAVLTHDGAIKHEATRKAVEG